MTRAILALALTLAGACAPGADLTTGQQPITACVDPAAAFGAVPDDGLDDSVALRAALAAVNAGGEVCIGPGTYTMTRSGPGHYDRFAALWTGGVDVTIRGVGPATVLELVGDLGAGTTYGIALEPGARRFAIRDLTIRSSATSTEEQVHALRLGSGLGNGTIVDVVVERVTFDWPRLGPERMGDCIMVLGTNAASVVSQVSIRDSDFQRCGRSGVTIQRDVNQIEITRNVFRDSGGADVDGEPTGGAGEVNEDWTITKNLMLTPSSGGRGDWAVTLTGPATTSPLRRALVASNVMMRGIGVYRVEGATIVDNDIDAVAETAAGTIGVLGHNRDVRVVANRVRRAGYPGPTVRLNAQSGAWPERVLVGSNQLEGGGFYAENASDLTVAGNVLPLASPSVDIRPVTRHVGVSVVVANANETVSYLPRVPGGILVRDAGAVGPGLTVNPRGD